MPGSTFWCRCRRFTIWNNSTAGSWNSVSRTASGVCGARKPRRKCCSRKTGAELLFEVVSRAYERTSLIVTTNLPFEAWTEVMGTERLTGALLDRLTHRIHILEANGESYRLRESKDRLKRRRSTRKRK
ncbi:MAG: ATP-binding protein [Planctomycetes bacterium]|nr:ATP-binding protein [Planctomycetota bacterium]